MPPLLVTRTYLRLAALRDLRPGRAPSARATLHEVSHDAVALWRSLYARVGGPWHWHDRDEWSDATLAAYLAQDRVRVWGVRVDDDGSGRCHDNVGLLELCHHDDGSTEIVYLGVTQDVAGRGLGAWLLCEGVRLAFSGGADSVWLHTCTLDGPAALPNYLARGFVIERTETYEATLPD